MVGKVTYSQAHGSSKLLYYKVSSEFLRQDLQSSYSFFGNIQNVVETELSEEKV